MILNNICTVIHDVVFRLWSFTRFILILFLTAYSTFYITQFLRTPQRDIYNSTAFSQTTTNATNTIKLTDYVEDKYDDGDLYGYGVDDGDDNDDP